MRAAGKGGSTPGKPLLLTGAAEWVRTQLGTRKTTLPLWGGWEIVSVEA